MATDEGFPIAEYSTDIELFEKNRSHMLEVLTVLDNAQTPSTSIEVLDELTQSWVKGDHWSPESDQALTPEQRVALQSIFHKMGLVDAVMPPQTEYDHAVILGGTTRGNLRYAGFTKKLLDEGRLKIRDNNPIDLLAGQRLLEAREAEHLVEMLKELDERNISDDWLEKQKAMNGQAWEGPFATETEVARLALMSVFGPLQQQYASIYLGQQPKIQNVPYRGISFRDYQTSFGQNLRLANAAAVQRRRGSPRHTSLSSAVEWLKYTRPAESSKLLVINANPHMQRTVNDVRRAFKNSGRPDLLVDVAGPEAVPYATAEVFLGEVARIIHNAARKP